MIKLIVNFCSSSFAVPIDDSMSEFNVPTGHYRGQFFQALDCTGADCREKIQNAQLITN